MRFSVTITAVLAALLAPLPGASLAAPGKDGLSVRVRTRANGPIPPKSPRGQADTVGIVGEGAGETEFRAVGEIAEAVTSGQESGPNGEVALRVLALPGRGGLQNIRDVLNRSDIDFAIAPSVVLEQAAAMPSMANLRERLSYVAPLYVEEVHLLARKGIDRVDDIAGKSVSLGLEGGSTEAVANAVLDGLGLKVVAENLDAPSAIDALKAGTLDAAFVVSGKPVEALRGVEGLHVVPIPAERVPDGFLPSRLTHADYPGLVPEGAGVETLGVQNVLFGYNWPVKSARGKVGRTFLSIFLYRLPDLQVGRRHPKWREVNVAATVTGWRRLQAMDDWLSRARPRAVGAATEAEFEAFLRRTGTRAEGEGRDALYRDFLRWRSAPVALGTR